MNWTDQDGFYYSFGMVVLENDYEKIINYGSKEKPFRLIYRKKLKIGFKLE